MANRFACCLASLLLACTWATAASAQLPHTVTVCTDTLEWPPFFYYQRLDGHPTQVSIGYTVDYLRAIFQARRQDYRVQLMPWSRCQAKVKVGDIDMLVDASLTPERKRAYLVSKPYYATTGIYFYRRSWPIPDIHSLQDLKKWRACGQHGYNYEPFGLAASQVDTGSYSLDDTMSKLKAGRCDLVLEQKEVAEGLARVGGPDYINSRDFAYREVPGMKGPDFHMMVSRKLPYGQALLQLLNQGISPALSARLRSKNLDLPATHH